MSSSRPLAVREIPEPLARLEEEAQTPEDVKDEKELKCLRNVMIFIGILFIVMGVGVVLSLVESVEVEEFIQPKIDDYHISNLAEYIVIEDQELDADWSGHTEDVYDFERTVVGDIREYGRAFIEV